jgi:hypothetical protein
MWNSKHRKAKHSSGVENRCGRSSVVTSCFCFL